MRYWVVEALKLSDLVIKVNEHIERGWKPIGGISVNHNTHNTYHYQAMVRAD